MSKHTHWQIEVLQISYASQSIIFDAWLSIPTHTQCTNENIEIAGWGANTRSLPLALFRFWKHCRQVVKEAQSKPGDFDLTPSNYTGGITRAWD